MTERTVRNYLWPKAEDPGEPSEPFGVFHRRQDDAFVQALQRAARLGKERPPALPDQDKR